MKIYLKKHLNALHPTDEESTEYLKGVKPGVVVSCEKKKRPKKTTGEKAHLNWVASLGCVICGKAACVHHIRISGEPRDHKKTIPLCYNHHQESEGVHTLGKYAWREKFGHELDFLKLI